MPPMLGLTREGAEVNVIHGVLTNSRGVKVASWFPLIFLLPFSIYAVRVSVHHAHKNDSNYLCYNNAACVGLDTPRLVSRG